MEMASDTVNPHEPQTHAIDVSLELELPGMDMYLRPSLVASQGLQTSLPCLCLEPQAIRAYLARDSVKSNLLHLRRTEKIQGHGLAPITQLLNDSRPQGWVVFVEPSFCQDVLWRLLSLREFYASIDASGWAQLVPIYFLPPGVNPALPAEVPDQRVAAARVLPTLGALRRAGRDDVAWLRAMPDISTVFPEFSEHEQLWRKIRKQHNKKGKNW